MRVQASKHPSIQASKHPSIQASKHPSIQASKHPSIQASKHPSIQAPSSKLQAILPLVLFSLFSLNTQAAPCESNFTSSGNFITGSTYKTFADLPNVSVDKTFEGALADIAKESSWKILAQDKAKGMIQAVQAKQYEQGKVIPLNINIASVGSGSKINMDYVTPAGSLSPATAVKSQFCQTIAAAENYAGGTASNSAMAVNETNSQANSSNAIRQRAGVATIKPTQQSKITKELSKKVAQKDMQTKIAEASKTIQPFLEIRSCIQTYGRSETSQLNVYAAPSVDFYMVGMGVPMSWTKYHDKAQCLTIAKIQGWSSPALNALQFEVLYLAEDSGETYKEGHELVKQSDGEWLFTR